MCVRAGPSLASVVYTCWYGCSPPAPLFRPFPPLRCVSHSPVYPSPSRSFVPAPHNLLLLLLEILRAAHWPILLICARFVARHFLCNGAAVAFAVAASQMPCTPLAFHFSLAALTKLVCGPTLLSLAAVQPRANAECKRCLCSLTRILYTSQRRETSQRQLRTTAFSLGSTGLAPAMAGISRWPLSPKA